MSYSVIVELIVGVSVDDLVYDDVELLEEYAERHGLAKIYNNFNELTHIGISLARFSSGHGFETVEIKKEKIKEAKWRFKALKLTKESPKLILGQYLV